MQIKNIVFIVVFGVFHPFFGQSPKGFYPMCEKYIEGTVDTIGVKQFFFLTQNTKTVILDTRGYDEFKVSHIPNARWVGYNRFSIEKVKDISKGDTVYVYCSIGYRSEKIGEKLKSAGYKYVFNVYGGIFDWANNGFPLATSKETSKSVHGYNLDWAKWLNKNIDVKL